MENLAKYWSDQKFFFDLINQLPVHIFWKDKNSVYLGCNEIFAKSLGLSSPLEIIGKTDYDLPTTREESNAFIKDDRIVMETMQPKLNIEEKQTLSDGRTLNLLTSKVPLTDKNGELVGVLGIYSDITERKKAQDEVLQLKEKLSNQNKIKSKFLHTLQHELRNSLSAMRSCCDIFLSRGEAFVGNPSLFNWLTIIDRSIAKIVQTLDRINNYSNLEDGTLKPNKTRFELKPLLRRLEHKHQEELNDKAIQLHFSFDKNIPDILIGDHRLIYDIVQNLFLNAIKYSPKRGKIFVMTKWVYQQKNRYCFDIIVEDQGQGILPVVKQTLFSMFETDRPDQNQYESIPGINLSISREFALILGGNLEVHSAVDKGSTFTLSLELEGVKEKLSPKQLKTQALFKANYEGTLNDLTQSEKKNKDKLTILLVEDNPYNTYALKEILSHYVNAKLLSASDFESAKAIILKDNHIDLVFTDIGLPDQEGYHIMDCLKSVYPYEHLYPYVVAITAYARETDIENFMDKGLIDVIPKPIALKPVLEVIERLFGPKVFKKTSDS